MNVEAATMGFQNVGRWLGLVALPALLLTVGVSGQNAQNQAPFRATVDFVSTDVIVRKDGKFVPDLKEAEFQVYEDGVLQKISVFEPFIGGRSLGNLASASPARRPVVREGLIVPQSRISSDSSGRLFIIFIDDLHFTASATPQVKDLLTKIRDTLVHDNDLVGFVSSGHSSIAINPAYDFGHRRFNEAIRKTMGGALTTNDIIEGAAMETAEGPTQLRYNAHVAFKTAFEMIDQVATITDRRKVFIYVSNGYNFNPLKNARFEQIKARYADMDSASGIDPNDESEEAKQERERLDTLREEEYNKRTQFAFADLENEVAQLARSAQRANVTFYTVDPRGLIAVGELDVRAMVSYADWRDLHMTQISTLKVLAEETGGFCLCETNDFVGGLRRIDAETSDYYKIGYSSSNPDPLKLRRQIRIEITRPGLEEPIYRKEYTLPRPRRK
jgi:VWFA-related protein